ncbi:Sec63 Brl domain-containing protein [Infundibulicybe gibba]|nr:Sec63 Brl domain-containing protein [Infundibulicybe gibba]
MANYNYDESGNMAAYFLITFLALVLIPLTFSSITSSQKRPLSGCQCAPCVEQRARVNKREGGSLLNPKLTTKSTFLVVGWSFFVFLCYRAAGAKLDNKVYNPFEILGLSSGSTEKEIKSHFKKLSRLYHPDKVKATVNQTLEDIQNHFVDITKAYKSLTDETIRENLQKYGHPDGRQELSMGIALPKWIIEGKNNIWVLGVYGLIFGGALPALVGRWWFGSRQKTKDGINARSAAAFFKSLTEEATMEEVVGTLGKAYEWELPNPKATVDAELRELETQISDQAGSKWHEVRKLAGDQVSRRRALILMYAHLLRIPVVKPSLRQEQTQILLQTPLILNALLNVSISRNWLTPTLSVMRLHAFLSQALLPGADRLRFAQLPGIKSEEADKLASAKDVHEVISTLEEKQDGRVAEIQKAVERWGRIEIVDASFKVIGERLVTPSSIVFLVLKLRISPPTASQTERRELSVDETKASIKRNEEKDNKFLNSRQETEELESEDAVAGWAHAPYWPTNRKPSWWLVLADDKSNRVVVPPMKVSDVPFFDPTEDRDYRSYKLQFQAPAGTGLFTWKIYLVSDTFIGEEVTRDIMLKIDDVSALNSDEQVADDDISDPDEDTLAGQMAAMRGGSVKKRPEEEESEEESGTDDDEKDDDSSDSDSD